MALGSQLEALPGLNNAARTGRLSPAAAKMIGEAATADPSAEADLLEAATGGLTKLRDECTRVKLAAAGPDHQARLRAERNANTKIVDGAFTIEGIGDLASGAYFIKILDALQEKEFELARKQGRHESYGAYRYDALMRMAEYARRYTQGHTGNGTSADEPAVPKFTGLTTQLILVANAQAWKRGHTEPGETVEIVGIGPIDVATAKSMVGDAFIDLVVTNGIEATTLVHASRKATRAQIVALLAGNYQCNVEGCDARTRLQIDHIGTNGWANTQHHRPRRPRPQMPPLPRPQNQPTLDRRTPPTQRQTHTHPTRPTRQRTTRRRRRVSGTNCFPRQFTPRCCPEHARRFARRRGQPR